jgi:hypothetical protein
MSQSQKDYYAWEKRRRPNFSVAGLCRFVACILSKDTFFEVTFGKNRIEECVGCDLWQNVEGLANPPRDVVLEGWSAVLGYLRTVSVYCRCVLKLPCMTRVSSSAAQHQLQLSSLFAQYRRIVSLVLDTADACLVFGPRSSRAHFLQPPEQLVPLHPPQLLSHSASMQLWCGDNRQRLQLMRCCCPLSTLASRLARANYRYESDRPLNPFEHKHIALIIRRCLNVHARRLLTECGSRASPHFGGLAWLKDE